MWHALESAMQQADGPRRSISKATVRRVAVFAKPHTKTIVEARATGAGPPSAAHTAARHSTATADE